VEVILKFSPNKRCRGYNKDVSELDGHESS